MTNETIIKVEFEISQIDSLLSETGPLLKLVNNKTPDMTETAALGLFLHSFYGGIENILKSVVRDKYGKLPSSNRWHKELLDLCCLGDNTESGLFSEQLKNVLDDYLSFRHFIRNTYTYKLKWEKMERLILNIGDNWNNIKTEIENHIEKYKRQPNA